MIRPVILILISIALGVSGLLLWRSALTDVGGFELSADVAVRQLGRLIATWKFWLGVVVLMGVVLISLELYGNEELSRIVPMYSMSYVLIALIGKFWLGEEVTTMRWVGIIAILAGVGILVRT
jgi:drug/metabolite transporter (DMT)-like permease